MTRAEPDVVQSSDFSVSKSLGFPSIDDLDDNLMDRRVFTTDNRMYMTATGGSDFGVSAGIGVGSGSSSSGGSTGGSSDWQLHPPTGTGAWWDWLKGVDSVPDKIGASAGIVEQFMEDFLGIGKRNPAPSTGTGTGSGASTPAPSPAGPNIMPIVLGGVALAGLGLVAFAMFGGKKGKGGKK